MASDLGWPLCPRFPSNRLCSADTGEKPELAGDTECPVRIALVESEYPRWWRVVLAVLAA
jgi:hypothetical protein